MDTSIFKQDTLAKKKVSVLADTILALSTFVQAQRVDARLNERGLAGILRLAELQSQLVPDWDKDHFDGKALFILCSLLTELMLNVSSVPGDLAIYGELESMLEEIADGEWFE